MTTANDAHTLAARYSRVADLIDGADTSTYTAVQTAILLALHELTDLHMQRTGELYAEIAALRAQNRDLQAHQAPDISTLIDQEIAAWSQVQAERAPSATISANGNGQPQPAAPNPTPPPERTPAAFTWAALDDVSREIVRKLDNGEMIWRSVSRDDRKAIALAALLELSLALPAGQTLSAAKFESQRPAWMPLVSTLVPTIGMSWTQMQRAAAV